MSILAPRPQQYQHLRAERQRVQAELRQAAGVLRHHLSEVDIASAQGSPDGQFGAPDLRAAKGSFNLAVAAASEHVLDQPCAFLKLDTASGEPANGLITWKDLDQVLADPEGMSLAKAAEVIEKNFGKLDNLAGKAPGPDGLVGEADLLAAALHPDAPAEVRQASLTLLSTPDAFPTLDIAAGIGGPDGLAGMADLQAFREGVKEPETDCVWIVVG